MRNEEDLRLRSSPRAADAVLGCFRRPAEQSATRTAGRQRFGLWRSPWGIRQRERKFRLPRSGWRHAGLSRRRYRAATRRNGLQQFPHRLSDQQSQLFRSAVSQRTEWEATTDSLAFCFFKSGGRLELAAPFATGLSLSIRRGEFQTAIRIGHYNT